MNEKVVTAEELFNKHCHINYDKSDLDAIRKVMIEFASLHVKAALNEIKDMMVDNYHTISEDGITKGIFKTQKEALDLANKLNNDTMPEIYHDWRKVTRLSETYDKDSVLRRYPLSNIK